jgi:hypothetical protein
VKITRSSADPTNSSKSRHERDITPQKKTFLKWDPSLSVLLLKNSGI